jgi:dolichyl-phosphate-mannose-protein mannosyltransferase
MINLFRRISNSEPRNLVIGGFVIHLTVALLAALFPEVGDEPSYKSWANDVVDYGIHQAYEFGYDWLPFYLYLIKLVGLIFRYSGLSDGFGPYSRLLTLLLKFPMILLNFATAWLIYHLALSLFKDVSRSVLAATVFIFNPAIILATDVFGYQDALHTFLVVAAVYCLCNDRYFISSSLSTIAFLTKPQAALFLLPIWLFLFLANGTRRLLWNLAIALSTSVVILIPFVYYGTLESVFSMYQSVPRIHQWLTGCAHNIWWLVQPVPPFFSDRVPLVLGLNGLMIGLGTFFLVALAISLKMIRKRDHGVLLHSCAFMAFVFFMVVTEIHENHLYAMFPFLAVFVPVSSRLRNLYIILTATFALDMALTLLYLNTGHMVHIGPVRVSSLNALINAGMLVIWTYHFFISPRQDSPSSQNPSLT